MVEGWGLNSKAARKVLVALVSLGILFVVWTLVSAKSGLFNNIAPSRESLRSHSTAWTQAGLDRELTRREASALVSKYQGRCFTQESRWRQVNFNVPLASEILSKNGTIECFFKTKSRGLKSLFEMQLWTVEFRPISNDSLQVISTYRRTRGMDS